MCNISSRITHAEINVLITIDINKKIFACNHSGYKKVLKIIV
jgi:hypothetical protein